MEVVVYEEEAEISMVYENHDASARSAALQSRSGEDSEVPAAVPAIETSCKNLTEERAALNSIIYEGKLYRLVAVSFGLLCILQAALNISLRLALPEYSRQGWVCFNGSFYYISSIMETWQASRDDCLLRGADLVIINSKEEQEFMRHFQKHIWIGLTDQEGEGEWKWVDGTPLTTSYWGNNEPNSHEGRDEDCGEIKFYDYVNNWNDKPCEIQNIWICEKTVAL